MRSLKGQAECLQSADLSPTLGRSLDTFIGGSLVQAHADTQAQEDLQHAQAAEIARASRQKRSRGSVQKGGMMYVDGARSITRRREEEEL